MVGELDCAPRHSHHSSSEHPEDQYPLNCAGPPWPRDDDVARRAEDLKDVSPDLVKIGEI